LLIVVADASLSPSSLERFFQKRKGREDPLTAALSTISITAIETVSAARAIPAALRNGTPPVTSGRSVSEYPKKRRARSR
jgi:hypothetical protein